MMTSYVVKDERAPAPAPDFSPAQLCVVQDSVGSFGAKRITMILKPLFTITSMILSPKRSYHCLD